MTAAPGAPTAAHEGIAKAGCVALRRRGLEGMHAIGGIP